MSISAMEQALEALIWTTGSGDFGEGGQAREGALKCLFPAITALRQAIAEAEKQEPVVYQCPRCSTSMDIDHNARPVHAIDISQERVDETAKRKHEFECPRCGHCCKEWVGLTEVDIYDAMGNEDEFEFARAIEAKLKEKNCG